MYKRILSAKLVIRKREKKTELTGKSSLRRWRSALDCSATEEEEDDDNDDDESFYHRPRFLVVVMESKRKRWIQHIAHMGKGRSTVGMWIWNFEGRDHLGG